MTRPTTTEQALDQLHDAGRELLLAIGREFRFLKLLDWLEAKLKGDTPMNRIPDTFRSRTFWTAVVTVVVMVLIGFDIIKVDNPMEVIAMVVGLIAIVFGNAWVEGVMVYKQDDFNRGYLKGFSELKSQYDTEGLSILRIKLKEIDPKRSNNMQPVEHALWMLGEFYRLDAILQDKGLLQMPGIQNPIQVAIDTLNMIDNPNP